MRKKRAWGRLRGAFAGVLWMIGMNKAAQGGAAADGGADSDADASLDIMDSDDSASRRPVKDSTVPWSRLSEIRARSSVSSKAGARGTDSAG